jgi:uncharacterized glyoxalase superfamily protein PhnB
MIIPCLRYADPRAAITWLGTAFGFTPLMVTESPDGSIGHVELAFDGGIVMLGATREDQWNVHTPRELGGAATNSIYIVVDDADAHHARAMAAGAEVLIPLGDTSYGSREYTVRDPEGHIWGFGTYRPNAQSNDG